MGMVEVVSVGVIWVVSVLMTLAVGVDAGVEDGGLRIGRVVAPGLTVMVCMVVVFFWALHFVVTARYETARIVSQQGSHDDYIRSKHGLISTLRVAGHVIGFGATLQQTPG